MQNAHQTASALAKQRDTRRAPRWSLTSAQVSPNLRERARPAASVPSGSPGSAQRQQAIAPFSHLTRMHAAGRSGRSTKIQHLIKHPRSPMKDPVPPKSHHSFEAVRTAARHLRSLRPVDLAPTLGRGIPRWPSHPHLIIDQTIMHENDGYYCQNVSMQNTLAVTSMLPIIRFPTRCTRQ